MQRNFLIEHLFRHVVLRCVYRKNGKMIKHILRFGIIITISTTPFVANAVTCTANHYESADGVCEECPDSSDFEAQHISACGDGVFSCVNGYEPEAYLVFKPGSSVDSYELTKHASDGYAGAYTYNIKSASETNNYNNYSCYTRCKMGNSTEMPTTQIIGVLHNVSKNEDVYWYLKGDCGSDTYYTYKYEYEDGDLVQNLNGIFNGNIPANINFRLEGNYYAVQDLDNGSIHFLYKYGDTYYYMTETVSNSTGVRDCEVFSKYRCKVASDCGGGGNSFYIGPEGNCVACPGFSTLNKHAGIKTCGNGVFECQSWSYKVRGDCSGDGYNEWACMPCPGGSISEFRDSENNYYRAFTFNLISPNSGNLIEWSTTERCSLRLKPEIKDNNSCRYNMKYDYIDRGSVQYGNSSVVLFSGATDPKKICIGSNAPSGVTALTLNESIEEAYMCSGECSSGSGYKQANSYTYAPAGWGITGNSCQECSPSQYSPAGDLTCYSIPDNSTKNVDGSGWLCNDGYYKNSRVCNQCPVGNNNVTATTGGTGATNVSQCFIAYQGNNRQHYGNGTWEYSEGCYYSE